MRKMVATLGLMLFSLTAFSQVSSYTAYTFNGRSEFRISSINPADAAKAVLQLCKVRNNTAGVCLRNFSMTGDPNAEHVPWAVSTYNKTMWGDNIFTNSSLNPGDAVKGVIAGCMASNNTFQVCVRNLFAKQIE